MLSIFAVVIGLVIIISAIAADRSARAHHTFRAVVLNLCGIGLLAVGIGSVYAWCHVRTDRNRGVVVANSDGQPAEMVRLLVGIDGRLERPLGIHGNGAVDADSNDHDGAADSENRAGTPVVDETPSAPAEAVPAVVEAIDLEDLNELNNDPPTAERSSESRSRVEIDFEARPEWVDKPERDVGEVHLISVTAGPFLRQRDARKALYLKLKQMTDEYTNEFVGSPHAARWIGYGNEEIKHRFVAPDNFFDEKVVSPSFGDMVQSHALLEFGPVFHAEVQESWQNVMARAQLVKVALGAGAILGMLTLLFGYFNADSATRGYYSVRLKFVTGLAILGLIVTGIFIARSIPWLWI